MTRHVPALIVGGGISGLVCAHALRKAGMDALLVEASDRPGGSIHSVRRDGYLMELGPQSFSSTPPLLALCAELGIEADLIQAPPHAPRYILVGWRAEAGSPQPACLPHIGSGKRANKVGRRSRSIRQESRPRSGRIGSSFRPAQIFRGIARPACRPLRFGRVRGRSRATQPAKRLPNVA